MKKIAILQSSYIPWKGYFDIIRSVDEFIIYDEAQYTKRDWRNRNLIKTSSGTTWLTIPVKVKGKFNQRISETEVVNEQWANKHWKTILQNYHKTKYFSEISQFLEPLYKTKYNYLSDINFNFIKAISSYMGIKTIIKDSSNYKIIGNPTEKLVAICKQASATEYITGSSAKNYIDNKLFKKENITLTWFNYNNYPQYPQKGDKFIHEVSILDLLFSCGKNSIKYLEAN